MQRDQFQATYPDIAGLLPQNFMATADDENLLRRAIKHDRTGYLTTLDTLARKTPAKEIRKNHLRLTSKTNFKSFYVEMKAYVALKHWVFAPHPADIRGTEGEPDYEFNIGELDIEVASRTAWDKVDTVRVVLEDKLENTPYTAIVTLKDNFIKIPYTGGEIAHNEQVVDNIVNKVDDLNPSNLPSSISNNGFIIEFEQTGGGGSIFTWESAEEIPLDPHDSIVDQLKDKVKKQRGKRPLLLFYDADVSFLEREDMQRLVHGTKSAGPNETVSDPVYQHRSIWGNYLRGQGYIPDSGKTTYLKQVKPDNPKYDLKHVGDSCICNGDEGLFADSMFDRVAGILFIDKPGYGHFLPNFYSQKLDFYPLYQCISQNMKTRSNQFKDLL